MELLLPILSQAAQVNNWPTSRIVGWSVFLFLVAMPFVALSFYRRPGAIDHHNPGFIRKYVFSCDHKIIGIQFLFTGLVLFLIGGAFALAVRWQLAYPFDPVKPLPVVSTLLNWPEAEAASVVRIGEGGAGGTLTGKVADTSLVQKVDLWKGVFTVETPDGPKPVNVTRSTRFEPAGKPPVKGDLVSVTIVRGRVMPDNYYVTATTMHASVMIFLVVIPGLVGVFGNFAVPLMIGAPDMAFPRLNMFTYWMIPIGAFLMLFGFTLGPTPAMVALEKGTAWAGGGWTAYPPLSVLEQAAPGSGIGQTMWALAILVLGTSALFGSLNYITTIVKLRAPGMTFFRMPMTVWSVFITSVLSLLSTPVLMGTLILVALDRVLGTSFYLPAGIEVSGNAIPNKGGGQVIMFQHLFWFYSHPAVYLMILPAMGIVSDVIATFARKAIFGYHAMVWAIAAIAGLGFIVWGHHMFQSGMNPWLGTTFQTSTMLIALPSGVKVFNWLGTLYQSNIRFSTAMLFSLGFVSMFIIGGLSGIYMAATTVDVHIHDTYFIVGHIHYVLFTGSIMAIYAGIYYWYPKMFGRQMSETLGQVHFWATLIFMNGVFFTMHTVGMAGMHRRTADPYEYKFIEHLHQMNKLMTHSALALGAFQLVFIFNFLSSWFLGKKADANPWNSTTLEWQCPSPPGHGNFEVIPTVTRGPYEYGLPDAKDDFVPQNAPHDPKLAGAH